MEKKQTNETGINTRYPNELLEELRKLAKQHDRSFNGEVIWALRSYVAQHMEYGPMIEEVSLSNGTPLTVVIHPRINIDFYHPEAGSVPIVFAYPKGAVGRDFCLSRVQLWDGTWECISRIKSGSTPPVRGWLTIHNTAMLTQADSIVYRNWISLQSGLPIYIGYAYLFADAGLEKQQLEFTLLVRNILNLLAKAVSFLSE